MSDRSKTDSTLITIIKQLASVFDYTDINHTIVNNTNNNIVDWVKVKEEIKLFHDRYQNNPSLQEKLGSLLDIIDDYYSKEIKLYVDNEEVFNKFVKYCEQEKIRFEIVGTYNDEDIMTGEVNMDIVIPNKGYKN